MNNAQIEKEVLTFWFGDRPEEKRAVWFQRDPEFDAEIVARFTAAYEAAAAGRLDDMAGAPCGCLALVIILDQFPRNMFRDDSRAFATDGLVGVWNPRFRAASAGTRSARHRFR